MSFAYELVNPPSSGFKAGPGYTFIYVLMFNIPGYPSKPYYVGQAQGLRERFGNHHMITWHVARFESPPRVFIAGRVPADLADQAEQNLITRLTRAGYRLTNTMVQRAARLVKRDNSFLGAQRNHAAPPEVPLATRVRAPRLAAPSLSRPTATTPQ